MYLDCPTLLIIINTINQEYYNIYIFSITTKTTLKYAKISCVCKNMQICYSSCMEMDRDIIQKDGLLTLSDIRNACEFRYGKNGEMVELCQMSEELRQGIDALQKFSRIATIYGSARLKEDHPDYIATEKLAYSLAKELGYAVLTGGGGGIMEAGNRGAHRAGGTAIGATIRIPHEQRTNPYVTDIIPFYYFFTRKVALRYSSELAIYCPGGFGTFDELFEVLTLLQTNKMNKLPVVLFGTEFWNPVDKLIKQMLVDKFGTINPEDRKLYVITDDIDTVLEIAAAAETKSSTIEPKNKMQ